MSNIGRCVIKQNGSIGGNRGVFYVPDHKNSVEVVDGAMVATAGLSQGDKIFAGDFGYFDYTTGMVTHLKAWKVKTAVTAESTSVVLEGGEFNHKMPDGAILAKAPTGTAGVAGTVTGVSITSSNITVAADTITLTISPNAFGALAVGDVLVLAVAAGSSKALVVPKVNVMFVHDIEILNAITTNYVTNVGSGTFTAALYYSAAIYQGAKVIPPYVLATNKFTNNSQIFKL